MQSNETQPRPALQGHVEFFDTDNDGIIWPTDTYKGFRAIGFGIFFSILSMVMIHSGFSYLTLRHLYVLPDPFLRLSVPNIKGAIHGSDSASYTQDGEFDQHRFDLLFERFTAPPHTHMSFSEGVSMVRANRNAYDPFGWIAAVFEWSSVYILFKPKDGRVAKGDVQGILDGTLFPKLAALKAGAKKDE
uniref:Caleosin-domain-containing protein n=1 Tax=Mycena chlorophos TaxID=658473 RepID=A0ABQ0MAV8_MYCCL|nr:predicted protein [Mycena chlorophos]